MASLGKVLNYAAQASVGSLTGAGGFVKYSSGGGERNSLAGRIGGAVQSAYEAPGKLKSEAERLRNETAGQQNAALDELAKIRREETEAQKKQREEDERVRADADDEAAKLEQRSTARERQKAKARAAFGRRDTILTGPLGIINEQAPVAKKTLLGA